MNAPIAAFARKWTHALPADMGGHGACNDGGLAPLEQDPTIGSKCPVVRAKQAQPCPNKFVGPGAVCRPRPARKSRTCSTG
jgi:hypothetical protein